MSIRSSIERSKDDHLPLSKKSYADINFSIKSVDASEFISQNPKEDSRGRLYRREFKVDKVEEVFKISARDKNIITVNQIRDFFDDIGFNVDPRMSATHSSDISLCYSVGGFLLPFYGKIVRKLFHKSRFRNLLLTKLSPSRSRLHCRLFHSREGDWYLTAHIDRVNWMNILEPIGLLKSHFVDGSGDYKLGHEIMEEVFDVVKDRLKKGRRLFVDINEIYLKRIG